MKGIVPCH